MSTMKLLGQIGLAVGGAALGYSLFRSSVGDHVRENDFVLVPSRNVPEGPLKIDAFSEVKPELIGKVALMVRVTSATPGSITGRAFGVAGELQPGIIAADFDPAAVGQRGGPDVTFPRSAVSGILKRGLPLPEDGKGLLLEEGSVV